MNKQRRWRPIPHGTFRGARTHERRAERSCDECMEALHEHNREYQREWRRRRKEASHGASKVGRSPPSEFS